MALRLIVNGQQRELGDLAPGTAVSNLIEALELKSDRVALELNGEISPRSHWNLTTVQDGDRVELVHFVGGGTE